MKVKCIGGPCDNEYYTFDDYLLMHGNTIQIHIQPKEISLNYSVEIMPETLEYKVELYKVAKFIDNINILVFLYHHTLTSFQALEYQFRKAIPEEFTPVIKQIIEDRGFEYSLKSITHDVIPLAQFLKMGPWISQNV